MHGAHLFTLATLALALCDAVPLDLEINETKIVGRRSNSIGWPFFDDHEEFRQYAQRTPSQAIQATLDILETAPPKLPARSSRKIMQTSTIVSAVTGNATEAWPGNRRALLQVSVGNILGLVGPFPQNDYGYAWVAWFSKTNHEGRAIDRMKIDEDDVKAGRLEKHKSVQNVQSVLYSLDGRAEILIGFDISKPFSRRGTDGKVENLNGQITDISILYHKP